MGSTDLLALAGGLFLAAAHLLAPRLAALPGQRRETLASFSGGAGLAYVFLYLLFELTTVGAPKIHALLPLGPDPAETVFIFLLAAFVLVYLVHMQLARSPQPHDDHLGFAALFATYNLLAGAGVAEEALGGMANMAFYVLAIGVHMLFNDVFLMHVDPAAPHWRWRALLAAMPVAGVALAAGFGLPEGVLYALLALVAGGTIINVLRNELPGAPSFRPLAFAAGVLAYAALIFANWRF